MLKFSFSPRLKVDKFLNENSLTILRIIMHYPKIFTRELMEKLENCEVPLKKAQIYRYLDCLKLYNLIIGNIWHKSEIGIGYRYKITKKGLYVLQMLSENFEI